MDIQNIQKITMNAEERILQVEKVLNGSENIAEYARKIAQNAQVSTDSVK